MTQYINKTDVIDEIKRLIQANELYLSEPKTDEIRRQKVYTYGVLNDLLHFFDTLEVKDPYEQCVQYDSIKSGIQALAETYSFNIESILFNQLEKEQQGLWKKEIEQAYINGGEAGVEFARDPRYKENLEVNEVDLNKEIEKEIENYIYTLQYSKTDIPNGWKHSWSRENVDKIAKHFFELGLKYKKI